MQCCERETSILWGKPSRRLCCAGGTPAPPLSFVQVLVGLPTSRTAPPCAAARRPPLQLLEAGHGAGTLSTGWTGGLPASAPPLESCLGKRLSVAEKCGLRRRHMLGRSDNGLVLLQRPHDLLLAPAYWEACWVAWGGILF